MTAGEAAAAAAAGTLGLPACDVAEPTARAWAGEARRDHRAVEKVERGELSEDAERQALRLVALVERELDEIERVAAAGLDPKQLHRLGQLASLLRSAGAIGASRVRAPRASKHNGGGSVDDFIRSLAAAQNGAE
jgi:hypothetical protein